MFWFFFVFEDEFLVVGGCFICWRCCTEVQLCVVIFRVVFDRIGCSA